MTQMKKSHFDYTETIEKIRAKKRELGKELVILTHHYQRKEIVELGDFVGDSFELSRNAAVGSGLPLYSFLRCALHGGKRRDSGATSPGRSDSKSGSRVLDGQHGRS